VNYQRRSDARSAYLANKKHPWWRLVLFGLVGLGMILFIYPLKSLFHRRNRT